MVWLELRCVCLSMWKREVQLGSQPSRASSSVLDWVIQDCFHRYVSDNEFASYFAVDTVFASELSLSSSCLDESPTGRSLCGGPLVVLSSHGILVDPFLRANDQRKHNVELFGTHGISYHERSHSACHLLRWKRTERSDGLQPLRFR